MSSNHPEQTHAGISQTETEWREMPEDVFKALTRLEVKRVRQSDLPTQDKIDAIHDYINGL